MMACNSLQYFFFVLPLTYQPKKNVCGGFGLKLDLVKADVLPEGVDVLLPLLKIVLNPGYQALTNISLTKAE